MKLGATFTSQSGWTCLLREAFYRALIFGHEMGASLSMLPQCSFLEQGSLVDLDDIFTLQPIIFLV